MSLHLLILNFVVDNPTLYEPSLLKSFYIFFRIGNNKERYDIVMKAKLFSKS